MGETFSIRVTTGLPSIGEMDAAAQRLGMSRNGLVTLGVSLMCEWDVHFFKMMNEWTTRYGMKLSTVMQNMLIRRLAEDAAEADVWQHRHKALPEFTTTISGPLSAQDLYKFLYLRYHREQGLECAKDILEKSRNDQSISEHEWKIFRMYGHLLSRKCRHDVESDDDTCWEGDSGYAELVRKAAAYEKAAEKQVDPDAPEKVQAV